MSLRAGQSPVVLLSAGVGATPVMSMLHALASEKSQREIWWIYAARNRVEHPFAEESRSLLKQLSRGRGRPKGAGAPDSPSTIQDTKHYLKDFDRLQKTAASDQALFDEMTELYPHWVANQSWLMFGFPGA